MTRVSRRSFIAATLGLATAGLATTTQARRPPHGELEVTSAELSRDDDSTTLHVTVENTGDRETRETPVTLSLLGEDGEVVSRATMDVPVLGVGESRGFGMGRSGGLGGRVSDYSVRVGGRDD